MFWATRAGRQAQQVPQWHAALVPMLNAPTQPHAQRRAFERAMLDTLDHVRSRRPERARVEGPCSPLPRKMRCQPYCSDLHLIPLRWLLKPLIGYATSVQPGIATTLVSTRFCERDLHLFAADMPCEGCHVTVSYTHLTLPTIYSV